MSFVPLLVIAGLILSAPNAVAGEPEWRAQVDAAMSAYARRDFRSATASLTTALKEAEAFGEIDQRLAVTLSLLAAAYKRQLRNTEAEPHSQRSLAIREKLHGPDHQEVGVALNRLAELYSAQGRYADAEPLYRRSLAIVEKALSPEHHDVDLPLNNLAVLVDTQGRYVEAEALYRRSLAIREKAFGQDHTMVATTLNDLAELYMHTGRSSDAELLYLRSIAIREKLGAKDPDKGRGLSSLARLYQTKGDYAAAEQLFKKSLAIFVDAFGWDHPDVGSALSNLAELYFGSDRYPEAEQHYGWALAISEKVFGLEHPSVGTTMYYLAQLNAAQGRYSEAELLYRRSLAIREKALGPDHPDVAWLLANFAYLHQRQKRWDEALGLARRATQMLAARFGVRSEGGRTAVLREQRARSWIFERHLALLGVVHGGETNAAVEEGFAVAQVARASDTAEQIANMAARFSVGSDKLAQFTRARQDASAQLEEIDARIAQALVSWPQVRDTMAEAQLRTEATTARKALSEIDAQLEREYPQYRELTDPKPLELVAAQKFLNDDEALVLLLVSSNESYLWVLRRGEAKFFKLQTKRSELVDAVSKLRAQLDLGAGDPERMIATPFDVAAAHDLYRKILGPAESLLVGAKHLIFVPDGAMQSLPLGVLVTNAPAKATAALGEHAEISWLAKKYAITVLPAASSLRALRQFARKPASSEPFGGFGDPVLNGNRGVARGSRPTALYSRGAVADTNEVRKMEPLPESADELRAIAVALNAPLSALRLGSAATERAVKEADLSRYRNLAFATHGLMAGEFRGLAEPALVLTPPEAGSLIDDGLLTAGEISQLKLDADWVVLSACNTAAPDGTPGAEGLSGLARAFFYAGARSLLVSHWSVSSDAAVALTTRMFAESAKGAPKAEALRRSMLALMQTPGKPQYAHPAFWAPFVVVGEGGAEARR